MSLFPAPPARSKIELMLLEMPFPHLTKDVYEHEDGWACMYGYNDAWGHPKEANTFHPTPYSAVLAAYERWEADGKPNK